MAVPKPMLTEFGIHCILESCGVKQITYHEPGLVDVLGLPVGVLDLLAEDQVKLEEEDVPLLGLADDDVLGVPHLEAVLKDHLPQGLVREVAALQHGQVEGVVGLLGDVEAHLQALLDLTSGLAAAGEQVLEQELVLGDPLFRAQVRSLTQ